MASNDSNHVVYRRRPGRRPNVNNEDKMAARRSTYRGSSTGITFTDEQMKEYHDAFTLFDSNNDGVITADELVSVLRSLGQDPTNDEVLDMIASFDLNENGVIEFPEFIMMMMQITGEPETEGGLEEIFRVIDQDGDGNISKADLRTIVAYVELPISHVELDDMFIIGDSNGDGLINFEDFCKIILARS